MKYEFEPHYEADLFKSESQDRVSHDDPEALKNFPWVSLGKYERHLPGRQMSFETHGEILGIESQEEWDKHVARYEEEIFTRTTYNESRIAPERELTQLKQTDVDKIMEEATWLSRQSAWHFDDMEKNGTDCEAHQDWLIRKARGHGPDLDYHIRDDIIANETTPEFEVYRRGINRGYTEGLRDVKAVEDTVPELVEIRDRLRAELIEAVVAYHVSEWGEEPDEDTMELMKGRYTQDKPIAKLVYMIEQAKQGNLVT